MCRTRVNWNPHGYTREIKFTGIVQDDYCTVHHENVHVSQVCLFTHDRHAAAFSGRLTQINSAQKIANVFV